MHSRHLVCDELSCIFAKEGGFVMGADASGLGYTYGAHAYYAESEAMNKSMASRDECEYYENTSMFYNSKYNVKMMVMMSVLTDLAFNMTKAVWEAVM